MSNESELGPLPKPLAPNIWGGAYTAEQMRAYAAQEVAAERERHAKQLQRWADRCDDLADHTDDHTRASLRDMAAEMRPNAAGKAHPEGASP